MASDDGVTWRPIPGFDGYEMSDDKRVRKAGKRYVADDGDVITVGLREVSTKGGVVYLVRDGVRSKRSVEALFRQVFTHAPAPGRVEDWKALPVFPDFEMLVGLRGRRVRRKAHEVVGVDGVVHRVPAREVAITDGFAWFVRDGKRYRRRVAGLRWVDAEAYQVMLRASEARRS